MARSGISTAIGTLLFVFLASIFLALMIRMFYDFSSLGNEVSSLKLQQEVEGVPRVELNYTSLKAAPATFNVIIGSGYAASPGEYTVNCSTASSAAEQGALDVFPVPINGCIALVRVDVARGDLGSMGSLTADATGASVFLEAYQGSSGAWALNASYILNGTPVNIRYRNSTLIYAYNPNPTRTFQLVLSGLKNYSIYLSSVTEVRVSNSAPLPLEVRAVWLVNATRELRVDRQAFLAPWESTVYTFPTSLTAGEVYEVRVVTRLRTYVFKFRVSG
ncbi:MAG: hypothetical protein ABWK01_04515 [Infirmifilum sp.]